MTYKITTITIFEIHVIQEISRITQMILITFQQLSP